MSGKKVFLSTYGISTNLKELLSTLFKKVLYFDIETLTSKESLKNKFEKLSNIGNYEFIVFIVSEKSLNLREEWLLLELWEAKQKALKSFFILIDIEDIPEEYPISYFIEDSNSSSKITTQDKGEMLKRTLIQINTHVGIHPKNDSQIETLFSSNFDSALYQNELTNLKNNFLANATYNSPENLMKVQLLKFNEIINKTLKKRIRSCSLKVLVVTSNKKIIEYANRILKDLLITVSSFKYFSESSQYLNFSYDCVIIQSKIGLSEEFDTQQEKYTLNLIGLLNSKTVIIISPDGIINKIDIKYNKVDEFVTLTNTDECSYDLENAIVRCFLK